MTQIPNARRYAPISYRYGTLRTDNSDEARANNDEWLGDRTLGIEVTIEAFAKRCGLGHIDPQHKLGGKSSAIEDSLEWPLPPNDSRLVTIRHDRDAIGAMAILMLRAEGKDHKIDKLITNAIGVLDRMPWHRAQKEYGELLTMFDRKHFDAMSYIVKHPSWPIVRMVKLIASIFTGEMPQEEMDRYARFLAEDAEKRKASGHFEFEAYRSITFCCAPGQYDVARNILNKQFPVAVVQDPERITQSGGKQDRWCVVRQAKDKAPLYFDRIAFVKAINEAEAAARGITFEELVRQGHTWGGPDNLVTSPQGEGNDTRLTKKQILDLVCQHYESGIVS